MRDATIRRAWGAPHPYDTVNDTRFNKEGEDIPDPVFVSPALKVSFN